MAPIHSRRKPKKAIRLDVVISVDRCLMSEYHGHEFLGFVATGPPLFLGTSLWSRIVCPPVPVDDYGRPLRAPYGLRKIEAKLLEEGYRAAIIDPDYLAYYLQEVRPRALLVGHHDYFALNAPSNEWWIITGKKPLNARSFEEFISMPEIWVSKKKYGLKIVVGGPAAWQWIVDTSASRKWPVDVVVEGEADNVIVEIVDRILNEGRDLDYHVVVGPEESPRVEDISEIKAPSINGLVEIMRGCPRGCHFCSVTLKPLRFIPLDRIAREIEVNIRGGVRSVLFQSEDVLLYGARGVEPRPEPLYRLHRLVSGKPIGFSWSHVSLAAVKRGEERYKLVSGLSEMLIDGEYRKFIGVEVGIETGSTKLVERIMPAKSAPYPPSTWPSVVEDSFAIMHENSIIPVATFILGLPGETSSDVVATIELLENLKHYRSLVVPIFFVPLGSLRGEKSIISSRDRLSWEHIEALRVALHHSLYWAEKILPEYMRVGNSILYRLFLKVLIEYIKTRARWVEAKLLARVKA